MKKTIRDDDECPSYVWDPGEPMTFNLSSYGGELRPTEVHVKPDGSKDERPSLCFVLWHPSGVHFTAQISLEKLMPAATEAVKIAMEKDDVTVMVNNALRKAEGR